MELKTLKVSSIIVPEGGTRSQQYDKDIKELAASIQKNGLINPITVVPKGKKFQIIAGRTRYYAVQHLGLKTIDANVKVLDAEKDAEEQLLSMEIAENLNRTKLSLPDEVEIVREAVKVHGDVNKAAVALSKPVNWVSQRAELTALSEEVLDACRAGRIKEADLVYCLQWDEGEILNAVAEATENNSVLSSEQLREVQYPALDRADFDPMDANLIPAMGDCAGCPFNSSHNSLFTGVDNAHCTKPSCYNEKESVSFINGIAEKLKEEKVNVLLTTYQYPAEKMGEIIGRLKELHDMDVSYVDRFEVNAFFPREDTSYVDGEWVVTETAEQSWERKTGELKEQGIEWGLCYSINNNAVGLYYEEPEVEETEDESTEQPTQGKVAAEPTDSEEIGELIEKIEKRFDNHAKWEEGIVRRESEAFEAQYSEWLSSLINGFKDLDFEVTVTGKNKDIIEMLFGTIRKMGTPYDKKLVPLNKAFLSLLFNERTRADQNKRIKLFDKYNPDLMDEYRAGVKAQEEKRSANVQRDTDKWQAQIDGMRDAQRKMEEAKAEMEAEVRAKIAEEEAQAQAQQAEVEAEAEARAAAEDGHP